MDETKRTLFAAVDDLTPDMIRVLQESIRIPTVNPPGTHYEEFVAFKQALLDSLGYTTEVISVPETQLADLAPLGEGGPRPNLVAHLNGPGGTGTRMHLNGHYDVVPVGSDWTVDPFGGELVDGYIYGRGSSDMKSGLVSQIYAVEALRRAGINWSGQITHSIVADEETVGNRNAGTGFLVEEGIITSENTDAVIITEPFGLDGVGVGHKGAVWGTFTIRGKQAHGSTPHLGVNAVEIMARFLARVEDQLQPKLRERTMESERVQPSEANTATLSFDTIEGGVATNVVPDRCSVTFNRRLVPPETLQSARFELFAILEEIRREDPRFQFDYHEKYGTDPTLVSDDEPLVRTACAAIEEMGRTPRIHISAGSHDQRFFVHNAAITNSILFGPGGERSHQSDERIAVENLVDATKTLALILFDTMGND